MTNQLLLIDSRPAWRLDQATRAQGLKGVANARAVLGSIEKKRTEAADEAADEAAPELTELVGPPVEQPTLPLADAA
ncbi:MAG: hypothetical protein VX742_06770 [Actinomycetota bacterium]|nr:hypothetical protein [Actinomycetota bacterium]